MTRSAAGLLLALCGCAAAAAAPGVDAVVPASCVAALLVAHAALSRAALRMRDLPLVLLHVALFGGAFYAAVMREPQMPLLHVVLTFSGPLLVVRCLMPHSVFNDFLKVLIALVLVVCSVARAEGWTPVAITAAYVLVACQAIPVLARPAPAAGTAVRVRLRGRAGGWRYMPQLAGYHLGLVGLLVGGALYLLVPRSEPDADTTPSAAARRLAEQRMRRMDTDGRTPVGLAPGSTGFPATVRLGDIGRIKRRDAVVLEARLSDRGRPREVAAADRSMLLLRARAWRRYDPALRAWTAPAPQWMPVRDGLLEAGDAPLAWRVELSGYRDGILFLPQRTRRVRHGGDAVYRDGRGTAVRAEPPPPSYLVAAARPVTRHARLYELRADLRDAELLEIPVALRDVLRRDPPRRSGTTLAHSVDAVRTYFDRRAFRYTLELPGLPEGEDPVAAFLRRREGHCELFASAACLFLRQMGVPARVAGGLRLAERVGPGHYLGRYRNAHAWVEIRCAGVGWVAIDFTPADARIAAGAAEGREAAGRTDGDASGTAGQTGFTWRRPFHYTTEDRARVVAWFRRRAGGWPAAAGLALLALPLLLGAARQLLRARRARAAPLRVAGGPRGARRTLAFYARWLRECARQGFRRGPTQTPREFLATLPPELRAAGAEITRRFERQRYGGSGRSG